MTPRLQATPTTFRAGVAVSFTVTGRTVAALESQAAEHLEKLWDLYDGLHTWVYVLDIQPLARTQDGDVRSWEAHVEARLERASQ